MAVMTPDIAFKLSDWTVKLAAEYAIRMVAHSRIISSSIFLNGRGIVPVSAIASKKVLERLSGGRSLRSLN
jgi:hypothetical protein